MVPTVNGEDGTKRKDEWGVKGCCMRFSHVLLGPPFPLVSVVSFPDGVEVSAVLEVERSELAVVVARPD